MIERVKGRRRWPWLILVAALLVLGGPILWKYRPLNAEEQRLIGMWRGDDGNEFTFCRDHSCTVLHIELRCSWSVSNGVLRLRMFPDPPTSWKSAESYWHALTHPAEWTFELPLEADDRGRLQLASLSWPPGPPVTFVRVPEMASDRPE